MEDLTILASLSCLFFLLKGCVALLRKVVKEET